MYKGLPKNEISRRSYVKIFVISHSAEDLKKDFGPGIRCEPVSVWAYTGTNTGRPVPERKIPRKFKK
jgi:hypothetical protein